MRDLLLCTLLALNLAVLLRWHERVGLFPADPADAAGGVIIGAEELTPFELGHGSMRVMWSTPLLRLNLLHAALQGPNPQQQQQRYGEMLALLLASVREGHARVAEEFAGNLTEDPASANGLNGVFFRWQTRHANPGWPSMFRTPESAAALRAAESFWQAGVDLFLAAVGHPEHSIASRSRTLHPWATVHADCVWHNVHTHPNNLVSGVFYLSIPPGSGKIIFYDPRGPLPPFDDTYEIVPRPGDLLIFPSWLPHLVSSSTTSLDSPRVSVAFNVEGSWHDTSAIATEFQVTP